MKSAKLRATASHNLKIAENNIEALLGRLPLQYPFPADPMEFYYACLPPQATVWLNDRGVRSTNVRAMLSYGTVAQFTYMPLADYETAVSGGSLRLFDDVFWLVLPEKVPVYERIALNIPQDHFAFDEVMKWRGKQQALYDYTEGVVTILSHITAEAVSVRELVTAFPPLASFVGTIMSSALVPARRAALLTNLWKRVCPAPAFADHMIEQLNTAVLLPLVDEVPFGLHWR
jgi:hypothetical protein